MPQPVFEVQPQNTQCPWCHKRNIFPDKEDGDLTLMICRNHDCKGGRIGWYVETEYLYQKQKQAVQI